MSENETIVIPLFAQSRDVSDRPGFPCVTSPPPSRGGRMTKGRLFGPFKSTDSRAPVDRFPMLVYAERYLYTASLRRDLATFCTYFDRAHQNEALNRGTNGTKPPHTPNRQRRTNNKRDPALKKNETARRNDQCRTRTNARRPS